MPQEGLKYREFRRTVLGATNALEGTVSTLWNALPNLPGEKKFIGTKFKAHVKQGTQLRKGWDDLEVVGLCSSGNVIVDRGAAADNRLVAVTFHPPGDEDTTLEASVGGNGVTQVGPYEYTPNYTPGLSYIKYFVSSPADKDQVIAKTAATTLSGIVVASFVTAATQKVFETYSDHPGILKLEPQLRETSERLAQAHQSATQLFGEVPLQAGVEAILPFSGLL